MAVITRDESSPTTRSTSCGRSTASSNRGCSAVPPFRSTSSVGTLVLTSPDVGHRARPGNLGRILQSAGPAKVRETRGLGGLYRESGDADVAAPYRPDAGRQLCPSA